MQRNAKIVATLGPSSQSEEVIQKLIQVGLNVARLNFSHGTHEEHAERIKIVRQSAQLQRKSVTILQDLQGPKLRVGNLPPEGLKLIAGQMVILSPGENKDHSIVFHKDKPLISMEVPDLITSLKRGNHILLDDGNLELEATEIGSDFIEAKVIQGGLLTSHKGVNLPGANLDIPAFTPKDRLDLEFGLQQGVDVIALSFIRTSHDVEIVRQQIKEFAPHRQDIPIIAKLERPEAINNLEAILDVADGVMVARGDLAVETSPALVPIMQKQIIQAANRHSKIVITATQMLESMVHNPRPTRAEASDVANAIFDGTDAVMLSAETAIGAYPVETVLMMDKIVQEAEKNIIEWGICKSDFNNPVHDDAAALSRAAKELAHDRDVAAIAVFTQSGRSALFVSKTRPQVPIIAFTPDPLTFQKLGLLWGVIPFLVPFASTVEDMLRLVESTILSEGLCQPGQQIILVSGFPIGAMRPPNFAMLHTIGETIAP